MHLILNRSRTGNEVYVNPDHITHCYTVNDYGDKYDYTNIHFICGKIIRVIQHPKTFTKED